MSPAAGDSRRLHFRIAGTYTSTAPGGWTAASFRPRIAEVLRIHSRTSWRCRKWLRRGCRARRRAEEMALRLRRARRWCRRRSLRKHMFGNVIMSRFPILDHTSTSCRGARVRSAAVSVRSLRPRRVARPSHCTIISEPLLQVQVLRLLGRVRPRPSAWPERSSSATSTSACAGSPRKRSAPCSKSIDIHQHLRLADYPVSSRWTCTS